MIIYFDLASVLACGVQGKLGRVSDLLLCSVRILHGLYKMHSVVLSQRLFSIRCHPAYVGFYLLTASINIEYRDPYPVGVDLGEILKPLIRSVECFLGIRIVFKKHIGIDPVFIAYRNYARSFLLPNKASIILQNLPDEIQSDVARRIATMDRTSPDVLREVERVLEKKLSTLSSEDYTAAGGVESIVEILNLVDRSSEKSIIESLEEEDSHIAPGATRLDAPDATGDARRDERHHHGDHEGSKRNQKRSGHQGGPHPAGGRSRSEERRVGKECRSRWSPYH